MPNIMLTDACNLHCPYCFANEFVNHDVNEISIENFHKAVDFIAKDGRHHRIGLIGGEPLLYSKFDEILAALINDQRFSNIIVYTNGIAIDQHINLLCNKKVHMLINCNEPNVIGSRNHKRLLKNLDELYLHRLVASQITLGVNIYKIDMDLQFIISLLERYGEDHLRISVTVPNTNQNRNIDPLPYFRKMTPFVYDFIEELLKKGIVPCFDCNKIPPCIVDEERVRNFSKYIDTDQMKKRYMRSNISRKMVECHPVVDIRQDLTSVRCFGLSEYTKKNIQDYQDLTELEKSYYREVDAYAYNTVYTSDCVSCSNRDVMKCMGGCLAFKINRIMEMQKYSAKLMDAGATN